METITIPLASIKSSAEYFRQEEQRYANLGGAFIEMRHWADGMASAYENIINNYGQDN